MNDNYMKTILSGVKEWTENLTDDAIDKANNAIDKANNAIDKALFVVNITENRDGTFSADKTFDEIVQAYNEGKYNIVANVNGSTQHLACFTPVTVSFFNLFENEVGFCLINKKNDVFIASAAIATTNSKLPNPYPLTFTGAVSETYDGSSAKTITIPSGGGGGSAWHTIGTQMMDGVETAVSFDLDGETIIQIIVTANYGEALTATKATVSLTLEDGITVDFTPQTMNATSFSPKNIFTIFGNSRQCRQMIFSRAEGVVYSNVQGSFGVAYGYNYYSEYMVEDKIATGITITFDKAPSNAAVVKVEGM